MIMPDNDLLEKELYLEEEEEEEEAGDDSDEGEEGEEGEGEEGEGEEGEEGEEGGDEGEEGEDDEDEGEGEGEEDDPDKIEVGVKRPAKKKGKEEEEEDDDDDEGGDVDPEDKKTISKVVKKQTAELRQETQDLRDEISVNDVIAEEPELKKFKGAALKYMKVHTNLTAQDAMAIVSSGAQQKMGAKKERDAAKKSKSTKSGGSGSRPVKPGAIDWANEPLENMEKHIAKAKGQR